MLIVILIFVILGCALTFLCYGALLIELNKSKSQLADVINHNTTEALTLLFNADKVKEQAKQGESVSVEDL